MVYFLTYLVLLPVLAAILVLPGRALALWLGPADRSRPRMVDAAVLGLTLWVALLFGLAVTGLYWPSALRLAALLVAGVSALLVVRKGASPMVASLAQRWRTGGPALLVLTLVGCLSLLFLHALNPTVAWDADVYHLTLPRLYLEAGGFRPVPFNVYSHWPSNGQLLYGLALALRDHVLAALLHFLFGVLTLVALFALCREAGRPRAGWLAAPLLLANGVVLFEMRVAYTDLATAFLFTAAALYTLRGCTGPDRQRVDLLMAGLAIGLLAGVKLTGWLTIPCLLALYLGAGGAAARSRAGLRDWLQWTLAPALLMVAPWLVRSALATGNPVYPFLYSWLGGVEWSAELAERFHTWQRSIGMGREAFDYLMLPVRVILEGGPGYGRFDGEIHDLWIALVPLALLGALRCRWARRCVATAGAYFALWALSSQQMRFLIPALPLLAAAVAITVDQLLERLPRGRWQRAGMQTAGVVAALLLALESRAHLPPTAALARGLWSHGFEAQELAVPPLARAIHQHTPADAHLLFVNTNRRFQVRRNVTADSFFEASQIAHLILAGADSPEEVLGRLQRRGITHLLLHRPAWSVPLTPAFHQLLEDPRHARLLVTSPDQRYQLFELSRAEATSGLQAPKSG